MHIRWNVTWLLDQYGAIDKIGDETLRWNAENGYFWTKGRDGNFDGVVEFYPDGKPHWKERNYHWVQLLSL